MFASRPMISVNKDFLSYESILQITDGASADADATVLQKMKLQYDAALKKSEEIVRKAQAGAALIEQEAFQKGFEKGVLAGEKEGRQKFDAVVEQFEILFHSLHAKSLQVDQVYQQNILDLIKVLADRLVGHEIAVNPDAIRSCLRVALDYIVDNSKLKIHLNPQDFQNILQFGLKVNGLPEGDSRVSLLEDAGISQGGCLISTNYGEIDATLENRRSILYEVVDQAFSTMLSDMSDQQDDEQENA